MREEEKRQKIMKGKILRGKEREWSINSKKRYSKS